MAATLFAVPASHPCAAVEAALRMKGVGYRRVDLPPPLHKPFQRALFGGPTVPGLRFEDGERVLGSRAILRALEARAPEPAIVSDDPRVEEAESWGERELQPLVRRLTWVALRRRPAAMVSYSVDARPPVPAPLVRVLAPGVVRTQAALNHAHRDVEGDRAALPRHLDRIDAWIADGTLGGERPNQADLQIGSSLRLALTLDEHAPAIDARPAGALARRWFPDYPGRA
jgi:glutathione S-transferase